MDLTGYVRKNREHWDAQSDRYETQHALQFQRSPLAWGVWSVPEDELHVLGDVAGKDVLELGCGAARWSADLFARGARCVGLDISARQLEHARQQMKERGVNFPLLHAGAEAVPLPDASLDIIFCDHGAMTFCDPRRTVPECARLLRSGGLLAFSHETPLHFICWDDERDAIGTTLRADYFEQSSSDDGKSVCFSLPYGAWIALFRQNGFVVEDLIELRAPENAETSYGEFVSAEWARKWPAEQIWRLRRV